MLEFERNTPIETTVLAEFYARCGWQEVEAAAKLDWVLAGSEEWVICKLDGELIGFGRSCRLGPVKRVVFDVLVDSRFRGSGLRHEIVRLLSENAGSLEEVSVFTEMQAYPVASTTTYTGAISIGTKHKGAMSIRESSDDDPSVARDDLERA